MLTIKRVPTMISLNQEEGTECGKNCLSECCIPGARLPLYAFGRRYCAKPKRIHSSGDLHTVPDVSASDSSSDPEAERSDLDTLILAEWEDRMERGLFRYDVTACETKTVPGEYGFIAQLNEGRHLKKRPTEFRVDQVLQDFDSMKFNFTKVGQEEVIFRFEESEDGISEYYERAKIRDSPNVVVINVSPIEYGHILLVPRVLDRIPQRIDADTFLLALHMAVEVDNPFFRIGYNSLGAFATINHLHFQAYYLTAPFPVERAPTERIAWKKKRRLGAKIYVLKQYPVRGLVFELGNSLEELSLLVVGACKQLQNRNIPFNILIADRGARIFLFPQCYAERQARGEVEQAILDTQVNPAVWEISGHIVLKQRQDYDTATQEYAWRLLAEVSLSEERFNQVKQICLEGSEKGLEDWPYLLPPLEKGVLVHAEEKRSEFAVVPHVALGEKPEQEFHNIKRGLKDEPPVLQKQHSWEVFASSLSVDPAVTLLSDEDALVPQL